MHFWVIISTGGQELQGNTHAQSAPQTPNIMGTERKLVTTAQLASGPGSHDAAESHCT